MKNQTNAPQLSFVPFCLFDKKAKSFWNTEDYSKIWADNNLLPSDLEKLYMETHNLDEPEVYKYPKCRLFDTKPTSAGVCHTFNSLELEKILKPSSWTNSFIDSFGGSDGSSIFKSTGIGLEDGFVFNLDTMQSYLLGMRDRVSDQKNVNQFWIKVHPYGDIPWMSQDSSSWQKITSYPSDMSTRFVTVKGEKIDSKDAFKGIGKQLRKCYFPDEGDLELFDYYSENNCKLECAWNKAKQICGCKPWHVPSLPGDEMCFILGQVCFDQIMKKIEEDKMSLNCKGRFQKMVH